MMFAENFVVFEMEMSVCGCELCFAFRVATVTSMEFGCVFVLLLCFLLGE